MNPRRILTALVVLSAFASIAAAQPWCPAPPLDDGFAVGCCQPTNPNLPQPPALTLNSAWGVYNGCLNSYTSTAVVILGAPNWFLSDYAAIPIQIQLPGMMFTGGTLLGKYARTWIEPDPFGLARQVWRVLVNGDIPFFPSPGCPAPSCAPPCAAAPYFQRVHLVGHIDYSCDPSVPNSFTAAFSLSHLPGCLQHASFSTTPIPALANSPYSYHLVGPAPFVFAPAIEPQGPLFGDTARSSTLFFQPFFYQTEGESEVLPGGTLTTSTSNCLCTTSSNASWKHQTLTGATCCFGLSQPFQSVPVPGTPLAPTGFAAFPVGQWVNPNVFPGQRALTVYIGVLTHGYTCSPVLQPLKVVTGVATTNLQTGGFTFPQNPATACAPQFTVLSRSFIDLQNMLPLVYWPNWGVPGLGSLFVSDWVLSLNAP